MIVDLNRTAGDPLSITSSVCVIGGGAAGVTIAKTLIDRGIDVCIIEAGGMALEAEQQALLTGESIGEPVRVEEGRFRQLGGATGAWAGRCAELDPIDFERRDWIPDSGWPISLADLQPFYRAAEAMCGFAQPWRDEVPALDRLSHLDLDDAGIDPFLWRFAPRGRNCYQNWGHRYRPMLERSRAATLVLHASMTQIEDSPDDSRIRAIVAASAAGGSVRIEARHFILCCGGIENARLLLNAARQSRGPLRSVEATAGRYFMQHPRVCVAQVSLSPAGSTLQNLFNRFSVRSGTEYETGFALSAERQREELLLNASASVRYAPRPGSLRLAAQQIRGGSPLRDIKLTRSRQGIRPAELCREMWRYARGKHPLLVDPVATIIVDVEQAPDRASRITLSDTKDVFGLNRVRVDWRIAEMERRTVTYFTSRIGDLFARSGWGVLMPIADIQKTGGLTSEHLLESYHHIGATRMSASPSTGTVDRNCLVHGLANLHLCGASVMPTGGHANPTFTIVALALRLADHLAKQMQGLNTASSSSAAPTRPAAMATPDLMVPARAAPHTFPGHSGEHSDKAG